MRAAILALVCVHLALGAPVPVAAQGSEPVELTVPPTRGPDWLKLSLAGAGVLAGVGLAAVLKTEADDRYDEYLLTADPVRARQALDEAERLDRWSLAGVALAQVSFVLFVLWLFEERDRPVIPPEGEPLVESSRDGLRLGWRVAP